MSIYYTSVVGELTRKKMTVALNCSMHHAYVSYISYVMSFVATTDNMKV